MFTTALFAVDAPMVTILPQPPYTICDTALVLLCTAEGLPVPQVQWYCLNKPMEYPALKEKALVIRKNIMPNIMMCTCSARNYAGKKERITKKHITIKRTWYVHKQHRIFTSTLTTEFTVGYTY